MGKLRGQRNRDQDRYWHARRKAEQGGMVGAMDVPLCVFCGRLVPSDEAVASCNEVVCRPCAKDRGLVSILNVKGGGVLELLGDDGFVDFSGSMNRGGPGGTSSGGKVSGLGFGTRAVESSGVIPRQHTSRLTVSPSRSETLLRFQRELEREAAYRRLHPRAKHDVPRKLTDVQALNIRERYAVGGTSFVRLGREFGVTPTMIFQIVTGGSYKIAGGPIHRPIPLSSRLSLYDAA